MKTSDSSDIPDIDLVYNETERTVHVTADEISVEIYRDVDRDEYDFLATVEELEEKIGLLVSNMVYEVLQSEAKGTEYIDRFISKIVDCYNKCILYQQTASSSDSDVITEQLGRLYKIEKASKHAIRVLSVVQNWFGAENLLGGQNLLGAEGIYEHYVYRYAYILGVHSIASFLAKMLVNKVGDGSIDPYDSGTNLCDAYTKLEEQGLNDAFDEEYTVEIQPKGRKWKMSAVPPSISDIERFHTRRNHIAHHSPLYVSDTDVSALPEEVVSVQIITHDELVVLTELASRLHHQMFSWLITYSASYLIPIVTEMVEAWYPEK